jgi:DNA transformation protein
MSDQSFTGFVLDQLSMLSNVKIKSMFGAYGLYSAGKFFGILDEGRLYFKTDAQSQVEYTVRAWDHSRMKCGGQVRTMTYHEVPPKSWNNRRN